MARASVFVPQGRLGVFEKKLQDYLNPGHSDTWSGTAADLASKGAVAIYPVAGWWKESPEQWDRRARYSLTVSIETPEGAADIYTPVFNMVRTQVPIVS